MHRYPRGRDVDVLGISTSKLYGKILPTLHHLALVYDEVYWDDRLDLYNHTTHFPRNITGVVDTMPVYVQQPKHTMLSRLLYNPKYAGCVYKIQLGFDFLGRIVLFSGPHFGVQYDGGIFISPFLLPTTNPSLYYICFLSSLLSPLPPLL